jgi:hypothetical protein
MGRLSPTKGLIFLYGLAVFAWWIRYHPPGVELLVFDDDARQHVYWTARFQDPVLFQADLLTSFISSELFAPLGYRLIYELGIGRLLIDPLPFSQLLTLILLLISLWLLSELSKGLIADGRGRTFLLGLFLFFSLYGASGGFPRTFAFPLLVSFVLLLEKGAFRWASVIIIFEALLYPPIVLNTMALAGWDLAGGLFGFAKKRRDVQGEGEAVDRTGFRAWVGDLVSLAAAVALTILLLLSTYGGQGGDIPGRQVTLEEARAMPEFHPGGRSAFFSGSLTGYLLVGRSGIGAVHLIGFAIILTAMGLVIGFRRIVIPALALRLTWTSLMLFGAAHLLLFRLHLPSRYTLYTLPLAFMLTIGANTGRFLDSLLPKWERIRSKAFSGGVPRRLSWAIFGGLLLGYAYVQGHYICRFDTQVVALEPVEREMLSFLEGLPKDALVAGHPMDMDNVPLLARRKVLANRELSLPYYVGYYTEVRRRLLDMLAAYYATDWREIEAFANRYRVDAMVVRKAHFDESFTRGSIYLEPFNNLVKIRWKGGEHFVLADPPRSFRCFENERFIVVCLRGGGEN